MDDEKQGQIINEGTPQEPEAHGEVQEQAREPGQEDITPQSAGEGEKGVTEDNAEPPISLDEDGNIEITPEFWKDDSLLSKYAEEEKKETPANNFYNPNEFAQALKENKVDESRLSPELNNFYQSARKIQQEIQSQQSQQVPQRQPMNFPPLPQPKPITYNKESWAQVSEAGKKMAADLLGEEFDEFNPEHQAAKNNAISKIEARAMEIQKENIARAYIQQQAQAQNQARIAMVQKLGEEFKQNPNFEDIEKNYFPKWRDNMTVKDAQLMNTAMQTANPDALRAFWNKMVNDYNMEKGGGTPPKPITAPPPVISATGGGSGKESKQIKTSDWSEMTAEERAEFLVKNKYVNR